MHTSNPTYGSTIHGSTWNYMCVQLAWSLCLYPCPTLWKYYCKILKTKIKIRLTRRPVQYFPATPRGRRCQHPWNPRIRSLINFLSCSRRAQKPVLLINLHTLKGSLGRDGCVLMNKCVDLQITWQCCLINFFVSFRGFLRWWHLLSIVYWNKICSINSGGFSSQWVCCCHVFETLSCTHLILNNGPVPRCEA